MSQSHPLKLRDCRELTPRPDNLSEHAEKLRRAAFDAVNEGDVGEMMAKMVAKAKAGDVQAMKFVLGYVTAAPRTVVVTQNNLAINELKRENDALGQTLMLASPAAPSTDLCRCSKCLAKFKWDGHGEQVCDGCRRKAK